jgi:uncharacterized protein (TIGR03086 family)
MTPGTAILDLGPAAQTVTALAAGARDDQLADPTPCTGTTVGALLEHLLGLTLAFRWGAEKAPPVPAPSGLGMDWRRRLDDQLDALVAAWRDPAAYEGHTTVGGVRLPASDMAVAALDELVLHGWDLAQATGQPFVCDPADAQVVLGFVRAVADAGPAAREGLFGPVIDVPADAPVLDRALGLAGRDPLWEPPG